jgi:AbrB family looped-hinge helix DNA binding protein
MKKNVKGSKGSVFLDLGFEPADAAVLQMRANLMADLRLYIEKNRLTQAEAAKRLGIAQSRTSDLPGSTGSALYDKVIDMDTVTISPKFQVVIPRRLRDQLGLKAGGKMRVIRYGDRIELLPARKASDLRGFLKGMDTTLPRDRDRV